MNVVSIFERIARESPDAIAINSHKALTYNELNRKSNRLARYLVNAGVQKGDHIGLFLDRSPEFITGILAILKAGACYVPVDTSYPETRIQFMLEDSGTSILLTISQYKEKMGSSIIPVVYLDGSDEFLKDIDDTNPNVSIEEDDVAYIMYTSGSTGIPKGTIIPHRGIMRLVLNTNYIHVLPEDTIAHLSNTSFDATTFEIWGALLNGASLSIIDKELLFDLKEFRKTLQSENISLIFITTALFNQIAKEVPDTFRGLKYVLFGGEKAIPHYVKEIVTKGKPLHLLNAYGPTENTTFSTTYLVDSIEDETKPIPIGIPISNSTTFIFSEKLEQSTKGELYVGGKGVALGYLNRPELTAERFITNPLSGNPKDLLYKTGDIVRELPDGNIEFIGRIDNQVKVRGYRIELPEIESAIEAHPSVREAVVILKEDSLGDKDIAAFYIVREQKDLSTKEVRNFLKQKLPAYMLPSYFVQVESFPITPNGKIDKKALEVFEAPLSIAESYKTDATTNEEKQMVKIWEEVLHYNPISINDNFFELGGHSFLAFQVFAKIHEVFSIDLPLRYIFESPTVSELTTRLIEYKDESVNDSTLLTIHPEGTLTPLFIVPPFNYIHHLYDLITRLDSNQPVFAFEPKYFSSNKYTVISIQEIASIYLNDLLSARPVGPYIIGGWSLGGVIAFEMVRQLQETHKQNAFLCFLDMEEMENDFIFYKLQPGAKLFFLKIWYVADKFFFLMKVHKLDYITKIYRSIKRRLFPTSNTLKPESEKSKLPSAGYSALLRKSQLEAFAQYSAKPLDCDVVNFVAIDRYRPPIERNTGCRAFVKGEYKEVFVLGNHNTFLQEPFISDVLVKFKEYLQNINNKNLADKPND